jgi:probable rRNA maturation factor
MRRAPRRPCKIDLLVQSDRWKEQRGFRSTLRRAIGASADELSTRGVELAIVLADNSAVRVLNRKWRGIDKATNVLSFPTGDACGVPPIIGDIVLAYETIAREGREQGKPFAHHLAHLAVHGFLHLYGYDHRRRVDAEAMQRLEGKILRRLAIPDPYRLRAAGGKSLAKAHNRQR